MIRILVKDGSVYQFKDAKQASLWLKNFPELYNHSKENFIVVSDKPFSNTLMIGPIEQETHIIECKGCDRHLKFGVSPDERQIQVISPVCYEKNPVNL